MRVARGLLPVLAAIIGCGHAPATAQGFDPRPSLNILITAFQRCGPPAAYQMLSPYLFTLIAQQTGGSGCYQFIAAAGPVIRMDVIESRQFPVGPVYAIRVTHTTRAVDWFIGFNQASGQVEYLNYQAVATGAPPSIETGPDPDRPGGGVKPSEPAAPSTRTRPPRGSDTAPSPAEPPRQSDLSSACKKFPQMCP